MKIADIMTKRVICCTPTQTAQEAAELMERHNVGALPVISDRDQPFLEGIVTDRDLCCTVLPQGKSPGTILVADLMTQDPVTCSPDDSVSHGERLITKHGVRRLPVVDINNCCIGIVSQVDFAPHRQRKTFRKPVAVLTRSMRCARSGRLLWLLQ
jgi:CBS domain-containing protein